MPLLDFSNSDEYERLYTGGFVRERKADILGNDHWALAEALDLQPGTSITLLGAGFGWIAEDWIEKGLGPIECVDNGQWIQENKHLHATLPILPDPVQQSDLYITEDVLTCYGDDEVLAILASLRPVCPRLVHWVSTVTPSSMPGLNWKTIEEWKVLVAPDQVAQRGTGVLL